jgi:hypothetical protein
MPLARKEPASTPFATSWTSTSTACRASGAAAAADASPGFSEQAEQAITAKPTAAAMPANDDRDVLTKTPPMALLDSVKPRAEFVKR